MNDRVYDIAVIGGGLAGLTLAVQAAEAGYTVVLFEKEQYPFHKVCGEYISMESFEFLKKCGVPLHNWNLPVITQLHLSDCAGKLYEFKLPLGGFGVSRYKLDQQLAEIAMQKGVHIVDQTKVADVYFMDDMFVIKASKQNYYAKVAAGAFGKRSNMDIQWKRNFIAESKNRLNNYIGIKYHIQHDHLKDVIALHNFKDGYCGISRIEDDKCCLCYLTTAQNLAVSGNSIHKMESEILSKNAVLSSILKKATFIYEKPVVISQISFDKKKQVENHILMIGDAAGLISPLCGNGMSMAMHASLLAFEQVNLFLKGKISRFTMEKQYSVVWKQSFARRLMIGRVVQTCFGSPFLTKWFLFIMSKLPKQAQWLIRQTHGSPF